MVRETRHLWVGNLPENIREDRIREHFKRYGRVQNVKLLARAESAPVGAAGASGVCATVAFMDIKSASKAHNAEHVVEERTLTTEYYEPAAIPATAGAPSAGSSPAGSGYSGSSSSVNSAPAPSTASRYHLSGGEESCGTTTCPLAASAAAPAAWRGTNDSATEYCRRGNTPAAYGRYQRNNSTAPYSTPPSNIERTTPHHRWYGSGERAGGGESTPSTPGGGTESGRRRRPSGSASSRSESSSPEPSDTSRASTPHAHHQPHHNNHRAASALSHQWPSTANGRPLSICVRNLPTRSTDSSLKDGLYHEYKKHGKVVWVKVVGQNADRYAVVRFKKPSDVEKALEVSQDKLFFGCKISVAPHQSCDDDADSTKPYETDIDEYHPKATRTLFIGNLEKDVTQQQLREKFKHFGRIIEIDIKKGSGGGAGYAFCQYASISSVVEAIRAMDGEYVGGSRVKLGFGKPVATACVWVDGLTEHTEKQVLGAVSRCGAATSVCVDRAAGAALVHFEQAAAAGAAVRELRRVAAAASAAEPDHPRLCVDYASRECQDAFYEQLEKHGGSAALAGSERLSGDITTRYVPSTRHDSVRYEGSGSRSRASSYSRATSRTPRYAALDHYDPVDYAADRRYRVYDETGTSPPLEDTPFEDRLQSVVVSPHRARRHRRDSSPEDRKHSKERRRSVGGGTRRSRSGSATRERHGARRRHRRRHDGPGSRAGTPLRDEPDAPPAEPRRPPRDRPPLPMCLPLPKFAAQLLRTTPATPRPTPQPAPAPDSPPRPPSVSSSSGGSAPHSPSLEERIRSLDEKYEKWSGSRAVTDAPDRSRLRHRLLEVDINEVKPSEVVSALLAKRSVFDEDSERLECVVRAPSPPEGRGRASAPRLPRYPPLPANPPHAPHHATPHHLPPELDNSERPSDPRLNRPERPCRLEKLGKINESDYGECRLRPRTPSTDRSQSEPCERRSPSGPVDGDNESRSRDSATGTCDAESKSSFEMDDKESLELRIKRERSNSSTSDSLLTGKSECIVTSSTMQNASDPIEENKRPEATHLFSSEQKCARDIMDMMIKKIEQSQKLEVEKSCKVTDDNNRFELCKKGESSLLDSESKIAISENTKKSENIRINNMFSQSHTNKDSVDEMLLHKSSSNISKNLKEKEIPELNKYSDKIDRDRLNHNTTQLYHIVKLEKENIQLEKHDKEKQSSSIVLPAEKKLLEIEKSIEDRVARNDRDKLRHNKDRIVKDKHDSDKEKSKNNRTDKYVEKSEKDKKIKEESSTERNHVEKIDKIKTEKDSEKHYKDKSESDKIKHLDEKSRHDHHKKERSEKDKKKENDLDALHAKSKKDDKHKIEKQKKDIDIRREIKKESEPVKSRKSSRDESSREITRKDSTDSSTSRASHESLKSKELDNHDIKEEIRPKVKLTDLFLKLDAPKESSNTRDVKLESVKIKSEVKDEKTTMNTLKLHEAMPESNSKPKAEIIEKHRHHSLDSPNIDLKRKERLNSCSSLPSNIGHKRRISSHDSLESVYDEAKKNKTEPKVPERRESKDSRSGDKHKTTKFSKGHFAKIIESKTKDDKKGQVKPPDDSDLKVMRKTSKEESVEAIANEHVEEAHNNLDFLALFELRSSEEDERQKALRKEMKEKKRIQQLQQIQELQMQQDAMQHGDLLNKIKDERKQKLEDKKKEAAREKRFSVDRKSRDEKNDNSKKKTRKPTQSSDTSDSDEPKKHSIFDIIDDGPTYISMYDKVKARSCKNMQKQEEEKRQEKIKAKFSQLKQSRAKREEKKRSSWDEDSDSESDVRRKPQKSSLDNSSDEERTPSKKRDKLHGNIEFDENKTEDYFSATNDEDVRNKLARKNSRTRIISDSSDEDTSKSKSPNYLNESKKYNIAIESINKHDSVKNFEEQVKKNSLVNLFGKSDSDDSKLKSNNENDTSYKLPNFKSICNDLSSECESITSNRNSGEFRRKHKKKPKKHKTTYSDDDHKMNHSDSGVQDGENRPKISDKQRRHSSKKDKRKEKSRDSIDTDDGRDEKVKIKREKRSPDHYEFGNDIISNNTKRDGKMEDIFGPLSDVSDNETVNKLDISCPDFDTLKDKIHSSDLKLKEKEDLRRKKEKRRKEKRWFREDDNSLDMDAVSKAIEARLCAESLIDEDNRIQMEITENLRQENEKYIESNLLNELGKINNKHDKLRRDSREKKKKKKRNKEDRQNRKEQTSSYHHMESLEKSDNEITDSPILETMTPSMLLDIPLPNDTQIVDDKPDDLKSIMESPSLPRLTESPPILAKSIQGTEAKSGSSNTSSNVLGDDIYLDNKDIEIEQIPMPPPIENIVQDISEVPLPTDPEPVRLNETKIDNFVSTLSSDSDLSEDAVRSISAVDDTIDTVEIDGTLADKPVERVDFSASKIEKKVEEKPRAIISQEETEDAVAALLGESFGGKMNAFSNYEESESNTETSNENGNTSQNTENIPEEDAEEMRQAVQNLNACELEMKPDTPVSDNDLLLIDTDTEEADETTQDSTSEKQSVNVTTNVTSSNNADQTKLPAETPNQPTQQSVSKSTIELPPIKTTLPDVDSKSKDTDVKIQLPRRDNIQTITSSATPVITSWTLTNNKIIEPHVINMHTNVSSNKEKTENKPTSSLPTNIVQIKNTQTQSVSMNNIIRPVLTPTRVSAPYQVISHMVRTQTSNMQPPTIKIPEQHILYQKPQGIVISPRMTSDPRIQSPKPSTQTDVITSPRLSTVPVLTSPQNLNSSGLVSPNSIHQRSPGQVTVVRVQQPPHSPIQTMHLPPGTMAMVSPNRPNSVLVQTQGSPLHHSRLPVTPILTSIPKQINVSSVLQQNKGVNNSPMIAQQKILTGDTRKADLRHITENKNENTKIILSPTNLQNMNSPMMAQNRLISMQNAVHIGNINSPLHLNSKFVINKMNSITEKRDNTHPKVSEHGGLSFVSTPIIRVGGVNPSIIQSGPKSVMCNLQDANNVNRGQASNVIHSLNPPRLLTPTSQSNVRQLDVTKVPPPEFSMATIRPSTVLTRLEPTITTATTSNATHVTPILIKSGATIGTIRINTKPEIETLQGHDPLPQKEIKVDEKNLKETSTPPELETSKQNTCVLKPTQNSLDGSKTKCETDFEELLKDNTNKIIVAKDSEKKIEVNTGKTTILTPNIKTNDRSHTLTSESSFPVKDNNAPLNLLESSALPKRMDENNKEKNDLNKTTTQINALPEVMSPDEISAKDNIDVPSANVNHFHRDTSNSEITQNDKNMPTQVQKDYKINKNYENVSIDTDEQTLDSLKTKSEDIKTENHIETIENQLKSLDENDSWSAKDLNIESVIKKVESLCNDSVDSFQVNQENNTTENIENSKPPTAEMVSVTNQNIQMDYTEIENMNTSGDNVGSDANINSFANISGTKRGGRSVRGKRADKNQDRVQTRQIAKTPRGAAAKRGRGRAKVDKKIKSAVTSNVTTMPGDIYDFHEDSGDEGSANKTEPRPRLILTIKSPLSGQVGVTATSTLSITPKDQNKFEERRPSREEKPEDFVSPSPNTRKSRRLQEKDVHRSVVYDVGEDGVRTPRATKRRPARQNALAKGASTPEKTLVSDTRKSPRGTKRTRDRSISDTSVDSADGESRKDEIGREIKMPRLEEVASRPSVVETAASVVTPTPVSAPAPVPVVATLPAPVITVSSSSTNVITSHVSVPPATPVRVSAAVAEPAPPAAPPVKPAAPALVAPSIVCHTAPPAAPTPITKPPKKMISEINAKLAAVQHRPEQEARRDPSPAAPATGEAQAPDLRRPGEPAPCAMLPVGATEQADARVHSPALPHRPPLAQRPPADRATPILISHRGGDGDAGASGARFRSVVAGGGGAASLPRGAHLPAADPLLHAKPLPVAVVGPHHLPHHHHHPGATHAETRPYHTPPPRAASRITSVPSVSPQGQLALGEGMYPHHFSPQHFQMYQQHFRATQHEQRATPSPFTRMESESSEAPASPLELRRVSAARVPRPAHSPSPADRHIMYAVKCGVSPPPAHGGFAPRAAGALPPGAAGAAPGAPGPPHASQVPHEADSLQMLLRRYPVMWQGLLALKNDSAAVQMHFVGGNPAVASETLARHSDLSTPLLRIAQRMRLEPVQLDQVHRKMKMENEHCILLGLPCGRDHMDVLQQSTNLTGGFITYLQSKQAAGIVNIAPPGHHQAMFTVHIFPSCDFANENLNRIAPDLMHRVTNIAHLLIVIATV